MTTIALEHSRTPTFRLILVIQHEHAYWFKVVKGCVVDQFVESVVYADDESPVQCPWISSLRDGEPQHVELILDSTLDEVDRVGVRQSNNLLLNRYRQMMTLVRLRRDYRHAKVYSLPTVFQGQVAAVRHPLIPEQWSSWLSILQDRRIVFHRVCTGSELIADWAGRCLAGCVLVVMSAGKVQRHMLVDRGAMVFLRAVSGLPDKASAESGICISYRDAIEQSIEHLRSSVVSYDEQIRVVSPHKPAEENFSADGTASCLVAMLVGLPVQYDVALWQRDNAIDIIEQRSASVSVVNAEQPVSLIHSIIPTSLITLLMRLDNSSHRWALVNSALKWNSALAPSVVHCQAIERLATMARVSLLLAVIAGLAAMAAIGNGVADTRLIHLRNDQRLSIDSSASLVMAAAGRLASRPVFTADSLFMADLLTSQKTMTPDYLLDTIATALMAIPEISVEHLVWSCVESEEEFDSLHYALDAVSHRRSVESEPGANLLQLEISGLVSGQTLRDQQSRLDAFVAQLLLYPNVKSVRVSESPVETALSSEHDPEANNAYRLSLSLSDA